MVMPPLWQAALGFLNLGRREIEQHTLSHATMLLQETLSELHTFFFLLRQIIS